MVLDFEASEIMTTELKTRLWLPIKEEAKAEKKTLTKKVNELLEEHLSHKARDARVCEFMKRQAEDCLVMAKHDDSINARNEADIWLKALSLLEAKMK